MKLNWNPVQAWDDPGLERKSVYYGIVIIITLARNSSAESQEPIFNNAVKAGAAAEPNSREEANKGSNWKQKNDQHNQLGQNVDQIKGLKLEIPKKHTFFNTIWRGSCSAKFGSLRKKVSFSTLSFKLRISMKCIVSTNLFWKYSAYPLQTNSNKIHGKNCRELYQDRKKQVLFEV